MPAQQLAEPLQRQRGVSPEFARVIAARQSFYAKFGKRALDFFSSAGGLLILTPLLALVAACIKLSSRGPVFYRQIRIGKDQRPFNIVKFRSMATRAAPQDPSITVAGDPRVTPIGRFLRRYKIDELPQLWNVVRGDMSLVGPRPEVPVYTSQYTEEQRAVFSVRPGITDPASLVYRDEEQLLGAHGDPEQLYRTEILPDKLARNRAYLRHITLQTDLRIILETLVSAFLLHKNPRTFSKET